MLTRLRVTGFKNLVDVEVRFGPLTCIAGVNGVGKSNILDAIRFLGQLADRSFVEAGAGVRGGDGLAALFPGGEPGEMSFEADLVIPRVGVDEFGQGAEAAASLVRYRLELEGRRGDGPLEDPCQIAVRRETLDYIPKSQAEETLRFPHSAEWLDRVVVPLQRRRSFISTEDAGTLAATIRLQQDRMARGDDERRGGGKPVGFPAAQLARTVLSSAQVASENRTAVLVRQELRSFRHLQLEPSALRAPDDFQSPTQVEPSGAHVPATLYRLAVRNGLDSERVYAETANRLARLVEGVRSVRIDRDDARRLLRFMLLDRQGLELPASSLSDGTLRFVALSVIQQDPAAGGVLCIEEPENGIHPQRVGAMLDLLYDIAVDATDSSDDNPLRQVILTTHSPLVVAQVNDGDLLHAEERWQERNGRPLRGLELKTLEGTWRAGKQAIVSRGKVEAFLVGRPTDEVRASPANRSVASRFKGQLSLDFDRGES